MIKTHSNSNRNDIALLYLSIEIWRFDPSVDSEQLQFILPNTLAGYGVSCKDIGTFFDGVSGAAITMNYNQMNTKLMRNKKLSNKIAALKKQLLNI